MNNFTQNNSFGNNYMNFGKPPRELDLTGREQLLGYISKEMKIIVTSVMGDQEAFQFAHKIKDFLVENGYEVDGINQAIYSQPISNVIVEKNDENKTINIIVGSNL